MTKQSQKNAMRNAEASVSMEGCRVTPQMERDCRQVLSGKTTTKECLRRLLKEQAARASK